MLAIGITVVAALTAFAGPARATPVPTVTETRIIGYSVQHRPILAHRLGDPASRTTALVVGQMHGDERAGVTVALTLMRGRPLLGVDLWVVPTLNPDGLVAGRRQNARGVDLNRNWPHRWLPLRGGYNAGASPLSEPETRAVHDFTKLIRPRYVVSLHQPLIGVDSTDGGARDPAFARRLATGLGLPITPFTCWSVCHGTMTGWLTRTQPGAAITVELGARPSSDWLTTRAPGAIVAALGGGYDSMAKHDPLLQVDPISASGTTVSVVGSALDPDVAGPVPVSLTEGGRIVASAVADLRRPDGGGHGYRISLAASEGPHTYCVVVANVGHGSTTARRCVTVTVIGGAPAQ